MNKKILIAVVLFTCIIFAGCSKSDNKTKEDSKNDTVVVTDNPDNISDNADDENDETEKEELKPVYDPHVWSSRFDEYYKDNRKESFFNLIDALRNGEDTFKCDSQEIYDWCIDECTLAEMIPAAFNCVSGKSNDGTTPYENGVGHIYYTKSKEEYRKRQQAFEKDIEEVLNTYINSSYSDFERCLSLYDYMTSEYTYICPTPFS